MPGNQPNPRSSSMCFSFGSNRHCLCVPRLAFTTDQGPTQTSSLLLHRGYSASHTAFDVYAIRTIDCCSEKHEGGLSVERRFCQFKGEYVATVMPIGLTS